MTTQTNAVQLVPFDADRAAVIAHLDAHPLWERVTGAGIGKGYLIWDLTYAAHIETYGAYTHDARIVMANDDVAAAHPNGDARWCAEAPYVINAVALRLAPTTDRDIIERLVEIYRLAADPGSPIALIASGQVHPE
jgi:hypothetical protein